MVHLHKPYHFKAKTFFPSFILYVINIFSGLFQCKLGVSNIMIKPSNDYWFHRKRVSDHCFSRLPKYMKY